MDLFQLCIQPSVPVKISGISKISIYWIKWILYKIRWNSVISSFYLCDVHLICDLFHYSDYQDFYHCIKTIFNIYDLVPEKSSVIRPTIFSFNYFYAHLIFDNLLNSFIYSVSQYHHTLPNISYHNSVAWREYWRKDTG